jgi:hypothetical protein
MNQNQKYSEPGKTFFTANQDALRGVNEMPLRLASAMPKKSLGPVEKKKTKRGATHKQGKVFLGRQLLAMTPAYYRRTHRGNPAKALREKELLEKRKWISAS